VSCDAGDSAGECEWGTDGWISGRIHDLWARVGFRSQWLLASAPCTALLGPGIKVYVTAYFAVPCGTTRFKSQPTEFR
jgi:hypothetical protein